MIEVIELIILSSLWCLALQISTSEGMVFYKLREYAESKKAKIWEAICLCPWCCPSIHSIFAYVGGFILGFIKWDSCNIFFMYPFVVAGSSLVTGLIWTGYKFLELKMKYYEHLEQQEYFNLKERKANHNFKKDKK